MDLRTRRKRKLLFLEKVGTAGPWISGGTETEDSPPGPPPGEGVALFSPSPEKEPIPTSPGCPRQGRFVDFLGDFGPGWDAGGAALLREVQHAGLGIDTAWGGAAVDAAPRSEKSIVQPRGLGTGRSVDLQPDAHGCPGKHGRQLWVRCGSGDNTRGGQPHHTFILRGHEPIPRCCDRHPIYRWCTE